MEHQVPPEREICNNQKQPMSQQRLITHWEWLLAAFCILVAWVLFDDFGLTWDASAHMEYGQRILKYYLSGFSDLSSVEMGNIRDKGPLFALSSTLSHWVFGLDPSRFWNFFISLFAILTLPALAGLGKLFGNQRVAVFSVVALLMTPRFIGHAFTNPKDIPFACTVTWSMFAMMRLYRKNRFGILDLGFCALSIGLALSMRPGGMFLFLYLILIGTFWLCQKGTFSQIRSHWRKPYILAFQMAAVFVMAWIVMIGFWPYAHQNPIVNPVRSLLASSSFDVTYPVLFNGKPYSSDQLPRYYMVWFLLISTPLNAVFLITAGFVRGILQQFRSWRTERSLLIFGTEVWVLFPIVYFVVLTPNIYDGVRHVLFILPGLALFAGLGADFLFRFMKRYVSQTLAATITVAFLISPASSILTMHPYQMSYFNILAGQPETIHTRYDTDYWLSSYKESAEWINQRQKVTEKPLRVLIAANGLSAPCALRYLDKRIEANILFERRKDTKLPEGVDYYLSTVRYGLHRNFTEERVAHVIRRNGVVFSVIKGGTTHNE